MHEIEHELHTTTRSELINKSSELSRMINSVRKKPMASFVTAPVPADFHRWTNFDWTHDFHNSLIYLLLLMRFVHYMGACHVGIPLHPHFFQLFPFKNVSHLGLCLSVISFECINNINKIREFLQLSNQVKIEKNYKISK